MYLILLIGIHVLLIAGVAVLVLASANARSEPVAPEADLLVEVETDEAPAYFFAPPGTVEDGPDAIENWLRAIEMRLRKESATARAFAHDPSVESLWPDQRYEQ